MKTSLKRLISPLVIVMMVAIMTSSCTANGKLRKPPAPPTPAGMQKPPVP